VQWELINIFRYTGEGRLAEEWVQTDTWNWWLPDRIARLVRRPRRCHLVRVLLVPSLMVVLGRWSRHRLRVDPCTLATVVDAAFMTTPHEAKARLFRVLRPEGRADGLNSFQTTHAAQAVGKLGGFT
jgi:hypothetical protein